MTRNYETIKQKIGSLDGWRLENGNLKDLNLINKLNNGICLHCICGHRIGKLETTVNPLLNGESNPELDKACDKVHKQYKQHIEKQARNSITNIYEESSLIPLTKAGCNDYILVGKTCAKYFSMTDEEIKKVFKKKRQEKKERENPLIKRKMSNDPKIFLEDYEIIDRGRYKGMSIYKVNTLKGGSEYLEFMTRWGICENAINSIEDLLYVSLYKFSSKD